MRTLRRPAVFIPLIVVVVGAIAIGMFLFQPWKLFTSTTVNEASPLTASVSAAPVATALAVTPSAPAQTPAPAAVVATGTFISHEHATSGTVQVITLPDGSRVLRIEGLDTSNGPDLKVWLTDAPVIDGPSGWQVFDDGAYVDLGSLKGNKGSQNYPIPSDADLSALTSVSIWCARFSVSFGAAELTAV